MILEKLNVQDEEMTIEYATCSQSVGTRNLSVCSGLASQRSDGCVGVMMPLNVSQSEEKELKGGEGGGERLSLSALP